MLWSGFAALALFVAAGLGVTTAILQVEKRQEFRILEESRPLMEAVRQMERDIIVMVGAARGYVLTQQTQFTESYEQAARSFEKSFVMANDLAGEPHRPHVGEVLDHRVERAAAPFGAVAGEGELQVGRAGQPAGEPCRQAVGRHDVEADPGQQHPPRLAGLIATVVDRFEDSHLAGDVQVVGAGLETRPDHRPAGAHERPGAVKHGADVGEGAAEDVLAQLTAREAFGRAAEPWEVATVMVFLASDYASYLTGEVLSVSSQHP